MQPGFPKKRRNFWTPLLFFLLLVLGIFIGFQLNKYLDHKRPIETVVERDDRVEEIIDLINERYVDSVNKNLLYMDAISGVLKNLDPHTTYIPANDMRAANEKLNGNFKGIGIAFLRIKDTVVITSIIKNGPSEDAGLKIGDKILKIDQNWITGKNISSADLINMVRGPEDSKVDLIIERKNRDFPFSVTIKRGLVPLYSINSSYMVDAKTGYIKIDRFSATTYREFMKSLDALLKQGMTQLILDLKQNPGGYLDAATSIADEFIGHKRLLVYTQGRMLPKENVYADKHGEFEKGKLVVLIDEGSASASEILAGAIQDWDRGILIGRQTYGKGLVQEQFNLSDGSALRLTVGRYYTPTGRNIQRPYNNGKQSYEEDYLKRFSKGEIIPYPNLKIANEPIYFTEIKHRKVYGGGGIRPDIFVPFKTEFFSGATYTLLMSNEFKVAVFQYYINHETEFLKYKNFNDFNYHFKLSPELIDLLKSNLQNEFPAEVEKVWKDPMALDFVLFRLKAQFAKILFGDNGYYHYLNLDDHAIEKAIEVLNSNEYSRIIGG